MASFGMLPALLVLCLIFSALTYEKQNLEGLDAARSLAAEIKRLAPANQRVVIIADGSTQGAEMVAALTMSIEAAGGKVASASQGKPDEAFAALDAAAQAGQVDVIACSLASSRWPVFKVIDQRWPALGNPAVIAPPTYYWPTFLMPSNVRGIANRVSVTAILAIGMTLVIITGGIDLSVGSLIALAAVISTLLIRNGLSLGIGSFRLHLLGGGLDAGSGVLIVSALAAIIICGLAGLFSGALVTSFRIPAFIVTLSMMLIARGLAKYLTKSESVDQIPQAFTWLGGQASLWGIPNEVMLMLLLYALAYVLMHHTVLGRYLYAVGGNMEAARLSGVPVFAVLLFAYAMCGLLAGLGGVVTASRHNSGSAVYGNMEELYVIAAVVVGGTSISGGEGKILGTLIGAFLIAVIENGMNLQKVPSEVQWIVLGLVILLAVLLDKLKQRLMRRRTAPAD